MKSGKTLLSTLHCPAFKIYQKSSKPDRHCLDDCSFASVDGASDVDGLVVIQSHEHGILGPTNLIKFRLAFNKVNKVDVDLIFLKEKSKCFAGDKIAAISTSWI